jgi:hypothetical protein
MHYESERYRDAANGLLSLLLLKIGVINATFKLSGIIPDENDKLKICVKGLEISLAIFIILALMPSYPELLFD